MADRQLSRSAALAIPFLLAISLAATRFDIAKDKPVAFWRP